MTDYNNDDKFKVIKAIWPFSRKLPILGDMLSNARNSKARSIIMWEIFQATRGMLWVAT